MKTLKVSSEAIDKIVDPFIDDIFDEDMLKSMNLEEDGEPFQKSKKMCKDEGEKQDKKVEAEEDAEEEDEEEEEKEDEKATALEKKKVYKKGHMHGVEHAHSLRDGMSKSLSNNPFYAKGFKDGYDMTKSHLDMKKASESKESNNDLLKTIGAMNEQIASLTKVVSDLANAPSGRKSVKGVDFLKKSRDEDGVTREQESEEIEFSQADLYKAQQKTAEVMYEKGVKTGKLTARDVAEYEFSKTHSDPSKKRLIKSLVNEQIKSGLF